MSGRRLLHCLPEPSGGDAPVLLVVYRPSRTCKVVALTPEQIVDCTRRGYVPTHPLLTEQQVRACYEGTALDRAHALAALTPRQQTALFGPSTQYKKEGSSSYNSASILRRIGRAIVDHCPVHVTHDGDCPDCARHAAACKELSKCGAYILRFAAKHKNPEDQVCAASAALLASAHTLRRRTARARREPVTEGVRTP